MIRLIAGALMPVLLVVTAGGTLAADGIGFQSYVTPFPEQDRYRVYVFGDAFGKGLALGVKAAFASDGAADVFDKAAWGGGVMRGDDNGVDRILREIPEAEKFHIAVVIFGLDDLVPVRIDKRRFESETDEWLTEYEKRIDSLIKEFKRRRVAVYWLGLPIMRGPIARANAERLNDVFRRKAAQNSVRFIDTWTAFAAANGSFTPTGPDLTGKVRLMRLDNGIHLTDRGYEKLAYYATREIRRDLAAARAEREVPLAGDETEQKSVRADAGQDADKTDGKSKAKAKRSAVADIPAENGHITVVSAGTAAQPANRKIEINRPAIPGAVLNHIRSAPNRGLDIGQTLAADLQGGLTALSSVALGSGPNIGGKARLSLTQSPFYKVLVKGEALPPKPGRADDFRWPRDVISPSG